MKNEFPGRHLLPMTAIAFALSACGGGDDNGQSSGGQPAPGAPALSFTAPRSSFDLANYIQVGRYTLPVGSGADLLAAEASGVTYNQETGTLFVVGDGGTSVVQVTKQGALVDSMTLAADPAKPQGTYFYDTEGIAWVGGNRFVLDEERFRQVDQFNYVANTTLDGAGAKTVKLGTTIGNIGNEGLSYDPMTGGFIVVKETGPLGIFQTNIDFDAGTASNGSPTTVEPADLFDPSKTGLSTHNDVFAFSNIVPATAPDYDNVVVISAPDGRVVKLDRAGNIQSRFTVGSAAQNEGLAMDPDGNLYVVGEQGGGTGHPEMAVFAPTKDKSAVGVGSNLYLTFPQDMAAGSGNIVISDGGKDVREISVTDKAQVSFDGAVAKIDPAADLSPGTRYSVTYAAGVFKNASGADAAGLADTSALAFTTAGAADKAAPRLFSSSPSDDATDVPVGAPIALSFNEAVRAGTGNIVIASAGDTRTIAVTDTSQVRFSGSSVSITPSTALQGSINYNVQLAAGVIEDLAGNPFAGITTSTALSFSTAAPAAVTPTVLITEVNSNAKPSDFFELYNYGTAPVDLSGWKWGDDKASFTDKDIATFPANTIIPAGERLIVINDKDAATFDAAWGIPATTPVVLADGDGPGLGGGDMVVIYDPTGKVVTSFNFEGTTATASDGTTIPVSMPSAGVTTNMPAHAGPAFGGATDGTSAVWDRLSVTAPTYKAAVVGELDAFAQPAVAASIGSPGK